MGNIFSTKLSFFFKSNTIRSNIENDIENNIENEKNNPLLSSIDTDTLNVVSKPLDYDSIKSHLEEYGYVVIPNVFSESEIVEYKQHFFKWYEETPGVKPFHLAFEQNGIFKYFQVGHQRFSWLARANPKIIEIFKQLWDTDELVTSFDGCCYFPSNFTGEPNYWTHTDQSSSKKGKQCLQSFLSLTDNEKRTFVVYEKTHNLHEKYFDELNIHTTNDWHVLNEDYVDGISSLKKTLHIKKGDLVVWDSRTFHQNTCEPPDENGEERLVQYLCYLPRNCEKNTEEENEKRTACFVQKMNTSHWPYPIVPVNPQPLWLKHYYNIDYEIEYNDIPDVDLDDMKETIESLL